MQLPLLYEKLEYLEVRSIGYNSPSFEPRISSNGSSSYKGIDYWLEKIDACERQIKRYKDDISKYKNFRNSLEAINQVVLDEYFYNDNKTNVILLQTNISRSHFYKLIKKINNKYLDF